MPGGPADFEKLEAYLRALAYASRLSLLHQLRTPRTLQELRLAPRQHRPGDNPERPMARQTLQNHLGKLVEAGVVVARDTAEPGKRGKEYVLNPQRLYQILEDFRAVGALTSHAPVSRAETVDLGALRAASLEPGPKLLLVHGLHDGRVYPLRRAELRDGRGWVLGRKAGTQVCLEYDPYVSLENSEVVPEGGALHLLDLRTSKNGTWLNWRRLERDERVALAPGDVVGVGRSLLVFRAA